MRRGSGGQDREKTELWTDVKTLNDYIGGNEPRLHDRRSHGAHIIAWGLDDRQLEAEETGKESQTRTGAQGMGEESVDYGRSEHGMSDHHTPGI